MARVEMHTKRLCPYCMRARRTLRGRSAEIDERKGTPRAELQQRFGASTYPQIVIGETYVGGCEELLTLDAQGGLDPLLFA